VATSGPKLWQKEYQLNALAERYEIGDDSVLDNRLVPADVWGSMAHAVMLNRIGVLSDGEVDALLKELVHILALHEAGAFALAEGDEDVHTKIENHLTEVTGDAGKKIHTARSRNDQVLVDTRLYTKGELLATMANVIDAADAFTVFAEREQWTPMPGYTHMQRAMLSSVGLWASAFAESLLDDLAALKTAYAITDQNPLGSAASYGVNLPIDRQLTTDLLGFARVQNNVLYTQNARGKFEALAVQALAQVMLDLSKFAQDMLLFVTSEYNFMRMSETLETGSSIMPQKRNPDLMELVRGRTHTVLALQQQICGIVAGLFFGYNIDFQETKGPMIRAFDMVNDALAICALTIRNTAVNQEGIRAACTPELFATDAAYRLVREQGMPFRDAYHTIARIAHDLPPVDPDTALRERTHLGASGNLGLDHLHRWVAHERENVQQQHDRFAGAIGALVATAEEGIGSSRKG
jgi:argininosuccinate lyase